MAVIEKSVDVNVPLQTAYNQWTQFEEFPRFMEGVKSVKQIDPQKLRWTAEIAGKEVSWDALVTEQEPDRGIEWRSTSGAPNSGSVVFQSLGDGKTKVTLRLDYQPEGVVEKSGAAVGVVTARVKGDLDRFKQFIEERGLETGSWRGRIHAGRTENPTVAKTKGAS